mmetsp:Transcript_7269/g.21071  ORF Transcript_7269/g.21071 Transcript_7269/m.21071 type:complete len:276 (+) Transcript_7269:1334-2161(+)
MGQGLQFPCFVSGGYGLVSGLVRNVVGGPRRRLIIADCLFFECTVGLAKEGALCSKPVFRSQNRSDCVQIVAGGHDTRRTVRSRRHGTERRINLRRHSAASLRTFFSDRNIGGFLHIKLQHFRTGFRRGTIVHSFHICQQYQNLCIKAACTERSQRVVVGEYIIGSVSEICGDRIVLVDDGNDTVTQQSLHGVLEILQTALVDKVALGEQNLRGRYIVLVEQAAVQIHQIKLTGGRASRIVEFFLLRWSVFFRGDFQERHETLIPWHGRVAVVQR